MRFSIVDIGATFADTEYAIFLDPGLILLVKSSESKIHVWIVSVSRVHAISTPD